MQGHVDGTGDGARRSREEGFARVLEIEPSRACCATWCEKGSVALDGVSLTVSARRRADFAVSLIPETLQRTNLGAMRRG